MNEMNEVNDGAGFDDHEPGDVNGNVDPAWAKKQKQQGQQGKPQGRRGPRAPRDANQAPRPAQDFVPRVTRDLTAPREQAFVPPVDESAAGSATIGSEAVQVDNEPRSQEDAPNENAARAHTGERRARGMRRTRRGAREPIDSQFNSSLDRPIELGDGSDNVNSQQVVNFDASPNNIGESGEKLDNPNPGAFGDPQRPMDRSARRNRNRNRNRERSDRGRAIREAREQAAANPTEPPVDGIVIEGEEGSVDRSGERLHKVLAQQGLGSRRAMESLIESGEVEVNGKPAQLGQTVNENDRVYVKRRKVSIKLGDDKPRIMIYHKPAGEIVTRDDPEARDTVFDRLPRPDHGRWIAIGRLDYNTEGLLLFTTSGELANRMMHPRYEIMREYSVRILGELTPEQEDELIDGIELDDGPARVLSLDRIDRDSEGANHWYRITINEGRNREVRRMFEHLGLTVSRLIRTRYGAVNMPSWLKRGQYKLLDENDTFNILEVVGMRSRKKLEKAARFGGARGKLPQQGPVGPMRSATEHEAVWTGAPAAGGMPGARGDRRNGGAGRMQRGRNGAPRGDGFGASLSLQQQQFPGFGGGAADAAAPGNRRLRGNKMRRGGGEVNGNVDPNFRGNRGRVRAPRANVPLDFDESGNVIQPPPRLGEDGQPIAQPRGQRNQGNRGNNRNRQGRQRNRPSGTAVEPNNLEPRAEGATFNNDGANPNAGAPMSGDANEGNARGRNRRGARRGGNRGRGPRTPREGAAAAGGSSDAPAPVIVRADE
jgi:23S rRNA pseudouridine2605 synthase